MKKITAREYSTKTAKRNIVFKEKPFNSSLAINEMLTVYFAVKRSRFFVTFWQMYLGPNWYVIKLYMTFRCKKALSELGTIGDYK